ncbi:MAG TPA: hypothetical protein VF881_08335 [Polyangiaceae bacterium]
MNQSGLFEFLNHWWNLPYLVMLGLVAAFFVLQIVGMLGGGDNDAEVAHGDAAPDFDHDADLDGPDHDIDHDADVDHDAEAAGTGVGWTSALSFFGVGRVPIMVVWVTFFIFAGFTGIFVNSTLFVNHQGVFPVWGLAASAGASLLLGLVAVRMFSSMAARLVDVGGRGSTRKHELSGKSGVVASLELDQRFGEVRVRDARGNELLLHGRLHPDEPALKRGEKVVLVDYDPQRELFWVTRSPEEEERQRP